MKRVVLIEEARDDLSDAKLFYDGIDLAAGDYCADSLLEDIVNLETFHGFHSLHFFCHRASERAMHFLPALKGPHHSAQGWLFPPRREQPTLGQRM